MKVFPFTLAANGTDQIQQAGRFIRCLSGNSPFDVTLIRADGQNLGILAGFQAGLAILMPDEFVQVRIVNGATGQDISLLIHDDKVDDNRLVGTVNITGGLSTKALSPTVIDTRGRVQVTNAAGGTQLIAAGTLRGKVLVQNCSANYIAIGPDNTTTYNGALGGFVLAPSPLGDGYPGGSVEVDANTTLYGIADAGTTNDVRIFSLKYAP